MEKRTIRRREKSEIINTEPVNINLNFGFNKQNKGKNKFKDTKNGFCMFIKKKSINYELPLPSFFNEMLSISFLILFLRAEVIIRCGKIESAISLKAIVAPWNNSR